MENWLNSIRETVENYVVKPAKTNGIKALAAGTLLFAPACQTVQQVPEVCHPGTPELVLHMPNGTANSYPMRGGEHDIRGPVVPSYAVGTLELLAKGDGCNEIRTSWNGNYDVSAALVDGQANPHMDLYAISAATPRNDDNTSFPLSRSSVTPIINENYSIGTLTVTDNEGVNTTYNVVMPVQYTPLQSNVNMSEDATRRTAANELSANYQQMTQDGRLVGSTPARILEDLTGLEDYDRVLMSTYARPDTDRNEVVFRGIKGDNTLSYGFVNQGMSPLERTLSMDAVYDGAVKGFFDREQHYRSLGE